VTRKLARFASRLNGAVRVTHPKASGVAQVPGLTDRTVCAVDAATGAEIGSSRKSRLTQAELAKMVKVTRPYITMLENGVRTASSFPMLQNVPPEAP
jgi:hypothetical protein